jgi:hypothetical protein
MQAYSEPPDPRLLRRRGSGSFRVPGSGPMPRRCPECELATPRQRPSAPRRRAALSGGRLLAADGCASSSSISACCFCGVWVPGGQRERRSPCSALTGLGMLICRIAAVACAPTYAQPCITFHDSARALTSRRQLLCKVLIWPHKARSPIIWSPFQGVFSVADVAFELRRRHAVSPT